MSRESLSTAVMLAGGQVALAAGICEQMPGAKIKQGHVWKWLNKQQTEVPPGEYVVAICAHLDWQITPHELRPDLYPNPTDALPNDMGQDSECRRQCERRAIERRSAVGDGGCA